MARIRSEDELVNKIKTELKNVKKLLVGEMSDVLTNQLNYFMEIQEKSLKTQEKMLNFNLEVCAQLASSKEQEYAQLESLAQEEYEREQQWIKGFY